MRNHKYFRIVEKLKEETDYAFSSLNIIQESSNEFRLITIAALREVQLGLPRVTVSFLGSFQCFQIFW